MLPSDSSSWAYSRMHWDLCCIYIIIQLLQCSSLLPSHPTAVGPESIFSKFSHANLCLRVYFPENPTLTQHGDGGWDEVGRFVILGPWTCCLGPREIKSSVFPQWFWVPILNDKKNSLATALLLGNYIHTCIQHLVLLLLSRSQAWKPEGKPTVHWSLKVLSSFCLAQKTVRLLWAPWHAGRPQGHWKGRKPSDTDRRDSPGRRGLQAAHVRSHLSGLLCCEGWRGGHSRVEDQSLSIGHTCLLDGSVFCV